VFFQIKNFSKNMEKYKDIIIKVQKQVQQRE